MLKLTGYEHHRLDQCEAGIHYGLAVISKLSDEEFRLAMDAYEPVGAKTFGDDWSVVKSIFESCRRKS